MKYDLGIKLQTFKNTLNKEILVWFKVPRKRV